MQKNKVEPVQVLVVGIFAAFLFIPFLGVVHLFDWDELNFAESAREMIVTGDFIHVQINYQPFWEKPPLFFWLQLMSMKVFGINEFAARFPNAICGILTLCTVFYLGTKYIGRSFAIWWVLFMAGSFTPHLYFKTGIIDPWYNIFTFLAIWQLVKLTYATNEKDRTRGFLLLGTLSGLAFLTKGPAAVLIIGLCSLIYFVQSRFNSFFSLRLLTIAFIPFSLIACLWVVPEINSNGISVLKDFILYQVDLFKNPVAGHGEPFYYHPLVLLFGCFPASIFAIKGMLMRIDKANPSQKHVKLWMGIMFWVVLILFSIVKTKIVHYSSLCYLPLTFYAARATDAFIERGYKVSIPFKLILALMWLLIIGLLTMVLFIEHFKLSLIPYIHDEFVKASLTIPSPWGGSEFLLGIIFLTTFAVVMTMLFQKRTQTALRTMLITNALLIPAYLAFVVPKIEAYSQGPAITFYERFEGRDVYITALGHKSYAPYFYAKTMPGNKKTGDINWLLRGHIDKPAYFVVKVNQLKDYSSENLIQIEQKGGFALLMRDTLGDRSVQ